MTIDKSWTKSRNRNSDEFQNGLKAFMERCKEHMTTCGLVRCPCLRCDNRNYYSLDIVKTHIHLKGFSRSYDTWIHHGERWEPPVVVHHVALVRDVMADGASDPSRGPWRRPSSGCEGSQQKKRVRGKASNKKYTDQKTRQGSKLSIAFDRGDANHPDQATYAPVGPNAASFPRFISNLIDSVVPKYYSSWNEVPRSYESGIIIPKLEEIYDLEKEYGPDPATCDIRKSIHAICGKRYRSVKSNFKEEVVKSSGAFENPEVARENPPNGIPYTEWQKILDFFLNPQRIARSKKNAQNSAKQPYTSLHGTKSYVRQRHEGRDAKGNLTPLVKLFHKNHYKKGSGFINDRARTTYEKMEQVQNSDPSKSNKQVLEKVLGKRRGHSRGVGQMLPRARSTHTPPPHCGFAPQSEVDDLRKKNNILTQQMQFLLKIQASQNPHLFQNTDLFQNLLSGSGETSHCRSNDEEEDEDEY